MTGRRLLDVAAIFKASRGVAAKHVALRQHQLDVYSKTSSLAKAIKSQTDRVTLTVKAASDLAERFSGPGPDHYTQASQSRRSAQDASMRGQDAASGTNERSEKGKDLSQDHYYKTPDQNTPVDSSPDGSLVLKQGKAKSYPLPNGSNYPADPAEVSKRDKGSYSGVTRTETVKPRLTDVRGETAEGLPLISSRRTSIPDPAAKKDSTTSGKDNQLERQAEEQSPSQLAERPLAAYADELSLQVDRDRVVSYTPSVLDEEVVSAPPRLELPKDTEDAQGSDEHVLHAPVNQDVFYSSSAKSDEQPVPQAQAIPEQGEPSDEAYSELFHSPKVARMLGGQPKSGKPSKGLEMPGAQETPVKQTKRPQEKDQVSSSIRTPAQESRDESPSSPTQIVDSRPSQAKGSEDVHNLAETLAKDTGVISADPSQVNFLRDVIVTLMLVD